VSILQALESYSREGRVLMRRFRYTVAVTTVWSGLSYVFSKNAVKILKQPREGQEKRNGKNSNDEERDTKP